MYPLLYTSRHNSNLFVCLCAVGRILWRAFKESANALTVPVRSSLLAWHSFRTTYTMFGPLARVKTQATFLMIFGTTFAAVLFWIEKGSINEEAGVDLIEGGDSPGFTSVVNAAYFVVVTYVVHKHALTLMWAPFLSPLWMVFYKFCSIVTVGYGDITPKTGVGKLLTVFIIMFGVFFTAMPLAIVGE